MGLKSHLTFDLLLLGSKLGQEAEPIRPWGACEQRSGMITSGSDTQSCFLDHCLYVFFFIIIIIKAQRR